MCLFRVFYISLGEKCALEEAVTLIKFHSLKQWWATFFCLKANLKTRKPCAGNTKWKQWKSCFFGRILVLMQWKIWIYFEGGTWFYIEGLKNVSKNFATQVLSICSCVLNSNWGNFPVFHPWVNVLIYSLPLPFLRKSLTNTRFQKGLSFAMHGHEAEQSFL